MPVPAEERMRGQVRKLAEPEKKSLGPGGGGGAGGTVGCLMPSESVS